MRIINTHATTYNVPLLRYERQVVYIYIHTHIHTSSYTINRRKEPWGAHSRAAVFLPQTSETKPSKNKTQICSYRDTWRVHSAVRPPAAASFLTLVANPTPYIFTRKKETQACLAARRDHEEQPSLNRASVSSSGCWTAPSQLAAPICAMY